MTKLLGQTICLYNLEFTALFKVMNARFPGTWIIQMAWNSAIKWTKRSIKTAGSQSKAALPGGAEFPGQSPLPSTGLLPGEPRLSKYTVRAQIQSSCTRKALFCVWTLGGEARNLLAGFLDLNNKAPMRPREGRGKEFSLDFFARWREPVSTRWWITPSDLPAYKAGVDPESSLQHFSQGSKVYGSGVLSP